MRVAMLEAPWARLAAYAAASVLAAITLAPSELPADTEAPLAPVGTGFTYQGFVALNDVAVNGAFDLQFRLFDAAAGGNQVGALREFDNVPVSAGTFSVLLDWGGSAFAGGARWLDIRVRPGASSGPYALLTPRQQLRPAPVALSLPNVYSDESVDFVGVGRDFRISGNEVFGIRVPGGANTYGGMYVETANATGWPFYGYATNGAHRAVTYIDPDGCPDPECAPPTDYPPSWILNYLGVRLKVPSTGGLRIGPSIDYSVVIENTTGTDGVRVYDTADDAIQIGSDPDYSNYGVYIPSPGVSTYGLWSNTAEVAGQWALYTVDNIEAGNVFAAGLTQIARVADDAVLMPGDVVSAVGVAVGVPGAQDAVPTVAAADEQGRAGVVGVVESRMAMLPKPGKDGADALALQSVPGPAGPGDWVAIVVRGVALVRVDPESSVTSGQRLTTARSAGRVRPLETRLVDGMVVAERATVLGIALGPSTEEEAEGLVPVYVQTR